MVTPLGSTVTPEPQDGKALSAPAIALGVVLLYSAFAERLEGQFLGHRVAVAVRGLTTPGVPGPGQTTVGILAEASCDALTLMTPGATVIPLPMVLQVRHAAMFGDGACKVCDLERQYNDERPTLAPAERAVDVSSLERFLTQLERRAASEQRRMDDMDGRAQ